MKKKGFTLIELLAVILILAIIALIAVPIIMNIIEKSNKKAFENSGYGIIRAGELYYSNQLLSQEGMIEDKEFTFPDNYSGLEIKGNKPTSGNIIINKQGEIAIAISNGKYCAKKGYVEDEIKIEEKVEICKTKEIANPVLITEITIEALEINVGSKKEVEVNYEPSNATLKELKWTSLDESIATVQNGLITGKKEGTTKIKVETIDGSNISKEIEIKVNQPITKIELNTEGVSLLKGNTYQIEATVSPSNASNKELKWTSLDESIATVQNGLITGLKAGTTKIKVETTDGSKISKEIEVTVRQLVTSISLNSSNITLGEGGKETVVATVLPSDAFIKTLKWSSLDENIATVQNGLITGKKAGTTKIKVETIDGSNITKEITVNVASVLTSNSSCIKNTTVCSNGTLVNVKVNSTNNYNFYVINDTGTQLTLIMDRNLGSNVEWITQEDYNTISGGANNRTVAYGPITSLNKLEERTSNWTYVDTFSYTLKDENNKYSPISRTNVKARMLNDTDATKLGCSNSNTYTCDYFLSLNIDDNVTMGYSLSSTSDGSGNEHYLAINSERGTSSVGINHFMFGVRPVIMVSKKF